MDDPETTPATAQTDNSAVAADAQPAGEIAAAVADNTTETTTTPPVGSTTTMVATADTTADPANVVPDTLLLPGSVDPDTAIALIAATSGQDVSYVAAEATETTTTAAPGDPNECKAADGSYCTSCPGGQCPSQPLMGVALKSYGLSPLEQAALAIAGQLVAHNAQQYGQPYLSRLAGHGTFANSEATANERLRIADASLGVARVLLERFEAQS